MRWLRAASILFAPSSNIVAASCILRSMRFGATNESRQLTPVGRDRLAGRHWPGAAELGVSCEALDTFTEMAGSVLPFRSNVVGLSGYQPRSRDAVSK
jgi:hypothetical protein